MRSILHRLENGERVWAAEIVLRAFGLGLLGLCAAAAWWIYRSVNMPPPHEARALELAMGLVAMLSWSLGWCFLTEGPGLFRLIDVPARYRRFTL